MRKVLAIVSTGVFSILMQAGFAHAEEAPAPSTPPAQAQPAQPAQPGTAAPAPKAAPQAKGKTKAAPAPKAKRVQPVQKTAH